MRYEPLSGQSPRIPEGNNVDIRLVHRLRRLWRPGPGWLLEKLKGNPRTRFEGRWQWLWQRETETQTKPLFILYAFITWFVLSWLPFPSAGFEHLFNKAAPGSETQAQMRKPRTLWRLRSFLRKVQSIQDVDFLLNSNLCIKYLLTSEKTPNVLMNEYLDMH